MLPGRVELVFPFVATLWTFILVANLIGLVPGLSSPTSDLSVTAALAFLVFLVRALVRDQGGGLAKYLKHYLAPNPIMLPFHLISEVSRTVALAVRLFGNVMSLEIAAVLVLMVAGLLVPVPLLMLHIVEALIQAYLFGMLALIYIAGGIQSQELRLQKEGSSQNERNDMVCVDLNRRGGVGHRAWDNASRSWRWEGRSARRWMPSRGSRRRRSRSRARSSWVSR